jgi:glyoxylase-like metal-dependent hydrolase (beta-lactamase superfamily II)
MSATGARRELGRGERVLPGVWRLRLPLPWAAVPHCNAWALAAGDGVVLVDCGLHEAGSLAHLERALDMVGLRLEHVRLLVCTHAHADHYGQAASVLERAGCELWMHPDHAHMTAAAADPEAWLARRIEVARSSGVPEEPLRRFEASRREQGLGLAGIALPDRPLVDGTTVDSDLGGWRVVETPGHAPSHVCLFQPERRVLISGDHVLGRVSLYFDLTQSASRTGTGGERPDPVGDFLGSLDRVEDLGARLCLSGHGRTFTTVAGHIVANRALVAERLGRTLQVVELDGPITAFDAVPRVHQEAVTDGNAVWWLTETLCYLRHLERTGRAVRVPGEDGAPERWTSS